MFPDGLNVPAEKRGQLLAIEPDSVLIEHYLDMFSKFVRTIQDNLALYSIHFEFINFSVLALYHN